MPAKPARCRTRTDIFALITGDIVFQWPDRISPTESKDVDDWLDLIKRKLNRSVVSADDDEPS